MERADAHARAVRLHDLPASARALAERAWHRADWELDYAQGTTYSESSGLVDKAALASDLAGFAAALGRKELPKLDAAGIAYRIPVPGASSAGRACSR